MAVPFGFSAGDFVAAIHLVHKISTALRETEGASSQYNQTTVQLQCLEGLLRSVQSAHLSDVDSQHLDRLQILGHGCYIPLNNFFNKIRALEPSLGSLSTGGDRIVDRAKKTTRKLQWGLRVKKELSELTAAIAPQISAINLQLSLINAERQEKAGCSLDVLVSTLKGLGSLTNEFQIRLDTCMGSLATTTSVGHIAQDIRGMRLEAINNRNAQMDLIRDRTEIFASGFDPKSPQRIEDQLAKVVQLLSERGLSPQSSGVLLSGKSFTTAEKDQEAIRHAVHVILRYFRAVVIALLMRFWIVLPAVQHMLRNAQAIPRLISVSVSDSILFEDALGRTIHLPYIHFRHHAVFMARLQCEFKNVPGEQKVFLGQFRVFTQTSCNSFLTEGNWGSVVRPGSKIGMSILMIGQGRKRGTCPRCGKVQAGLNIRHHSRSDKRWNLKNLPRCTACGLTWDTNEFKPPRASLGRKSSYKPRPKPSATPREVVSSFTDNADIKSFKILHVLSQATKCDFHDRWISARFHREERFKRMRMERRLQRAQDKRGQLESNSLDLSVTCGHWQRHISYENRLDTPSKL